MLPLPGPGRVAAASPRGYNPMPWLSVPLPRRVGVASEQLALTDW